MKRLDFYERREWNIKKAKHFACELKTILSRKTKTGKIRTTKCLGYFSTEIKFPSGIKALFAKTSPKS